MPGLVSLSCAINRADWFLCKLASFSFVFYYCGEPDAWIGFCYDPSLTVTHRVAQIREIDTRFRVSGWKERKNRRVQKFQIYNPR